MLVRWLPCNLYILKMVVFLFSSVILFFIIGIMLKWWAWGDLTIWSNFTKRHKICIVDLECFFFIRTHSHYYFFRLFNFSPMWWNHFKTGIRWLDFKKKVLSRSFRVLKHQSHWIVNFIVQWLWNFVQHAYRKEKYTSANHEICLTFLINGNKSDFHWKLQYTNLKGF